MKRTHFCAGRLTAAVLALLLLAALLLPGCAAQPENGKKTLVLTIFPALAFAEGVPLIDVRRQFLPQRDLSGLIAADGIHLTMSGYRCLFDTLADWVRARL